MSERSARTPPDFPGEAYYRQAQTREKPAWPVDTGRSIVLIEVRRAGPLAHLGHDHVVASRDIRGYVSLADGRADLAIPLDRLTVDETALRAEAGFATQLTAAAIDGTRRNLHERVLDTARHPYALISIIRDSAEASALKVSMTLRGVTRTFVVPAEISVAPDSITVTGRMALQQSEFGIEPLAVLGGALQVQDRLDLRFRIVATRP